MKSTQNVALMDVKIHVKIQLLVKSVEQHALLDVSAMKATSVTQMENVFLPKNALQFYHNVTQQITKSTQNVMLILVKNHVKF